LKVVWEGKVKRGRFSEPLRPTCTGFKDVTQALKTPAQNLVFRSIVSETFTGESLKHGPSGYDAIEFVSKRRGEESMFGKGLYGSMR